jgi:hypothetical protein
MNNFRYPSIRAFLDRIVADKAIGEREYRKLSFEEKLKRLVKLQEKAFFMGQMKFHPWPIL